MNTNVRIGLCLLGFILPSLVGYMVFYNPFFYSLEIILYSIIITIGIYFSTGGELSSSYQKEKQIDDTTVILLYILSFFIPLAGFIVGAIYASKEEEHYKHVGKNCLIFSVMNIVFGFIMIVAILGSM